MTDKYALTMMVDQRISADHFCTTIHVNVDNAKLSDAEFREFIRNTLPIVKYSRPEKKNAD